MSRLYFATQVKPVLFLASILLMRSFVYAHAPAVFFVQAAPETIVKVEPYSSSTNVGETFIVNITIVGVQNLYGVEVTLCWNASLLEVVSLDLRLGVESRPDGVLHELPSAPIFVAENDVIEEQGKYRLAATSTAPAPSFNGSGNIVRLTFNTTNIGNSELDLETQLYDYPPPDREPRISWPIEHTTIDGFVEAIPEFPNVITLLLFIVLTIFVAILSKRFYKNRFTLFDSSSSNKVY